MSIGLSFSVGVDSVSNSSGEKSVTYPSFIERVIKGEGSSRILIKGDSLSVGSKGGDAGNNINARKNNWPKKFSELCIAAGIKTRFDSWANGAYGYASITDAAAYDPRMTFGSWVIENRFGISTRCIRNNSDTTTWSMNPESAFNALEVWYIINAVSSASAFTVKVNGVIVATINTSISVNGGVERMEKTVITGLTKQIQTIEINRIGGDCRPQALIPYCSDESELIIVSSAASGATVTSFNGTANAYSTGFTGAYFPRDLMIVELGVNDILGSTVLMNFENMLDAIDTNDGAAGDILWQTSPYINSEISPFNTQDGYFNAIRACAINNNRPLLDINESWESYENAVLLGWQDVDGVHQTKSGYEQRAIETFAAVMALS